MLGDLPFVKLIIPLHRAQDKSRPIFLPFYGGVLLLNLFVIGLLGLWQYQSWRQHRARAVTATENLAGALEHDILDNIGMVDIALLALAQEKSRQPQGPIDISAYSRYFAAIRQRIPELYALRISDAAGHLIASSDEKTMPAEAGRDFVQPALFHRGTRQSQGWPGDLRTADRPYQP